MIKFLVTFIGILNGCPFSTFEEGLLPRNQTSASLLKLFPLIQDGASFSIGIWTFASGKMNNNYQTDTQGILSVTDQLGNPIIEIYQKPDLELNYLINYLLDPNNEKQQSFKYIIPFYEYQDTWYFTLITFSNQYRNIIFEMTSQQKKILNIQSFKPNKEYQFKISFYDAIKEPQCCGQSKQRYPFTGRISNPIFFENYQYSENSFQEFSNYCMIPEEKVGEQITQIISGLVDLTGKGVIQLNFQEYGRKYCIQGWVKFSESFAFQTNQVLLRVSQNSNKDNIKNVGDDLLNLEYFISKQFPSKSKIRIAIDSYCYRQQQFCLITYNSNIQSYKTYQFEFLNDQDDSFYYGLTQWHYFQYEYGRNKSNGIGMIFQMQFFNSIGYISQELQQIYKGTWANGIFYISIGEKAINSDYLKASISNLKIIHNYKIDKEFFFSCHKTCQTCDGPLENNCLSCELSNANRVYVVSQKQCFCREGYFQKEDMTCIRLENYFSSIELFQLQDDIKNSYCQLGYFVVQLPDGGSQCIKCPQENPISILCADCWLQQNTWQNNLTCTSDFTLGNSNLSNDYSLILRKIEEYDFYIINDNFHLILLEGYQGFCQNNLPNPKCHKIHKKNLKNDINAACKPNFFLDQNGCHLNQMNCQTYDDEGYCISCSDRHYLKEKLCIFCPQNCQECSYDKQQKRVICLKCLSSFGLINQNCEKCGKNCLICQENISQDSKFLFCIKCVDVSEYFVSYDKINCAKNYIEGCKYAIQYAKDEVIGNYYLSPYVEDAEFVTVCAFSKRPSSYTIGDNFVLDQQSDCDFIVRIDLSECLSGETDFFKASFFHLCDSKIKNCKYCLLSYADFTNICLICLEGYYADRLSGLCQICPPELNCQVCVHQQKFQKDFGFTNQGHLFQTIQSI